MSWSLMNTGMNESIPGTMNRMFVHLACEQTPFTLKTMNKPTVAISMQMDTKSQAKRLLQRMCPMRNGWRKLNL